MTWMLILLALDLSTIKSEPNLEKRSELALDYANSAVDAVRDAYSAGDVSKALSALGEIGESVELSWHSLNDTGKYARNNKFYKRAEVRTRELLRRLDGLRDTVALEDQAAVEKVRARVADVHDELVQAIMGKKAK